MDTLQLLTIILGIAGIAGGATGYFAKSKGDTIISLQGKEIDYWRDKAGALDKDLAASRAKEQEKDERIEILITQNKQLVELGQGSPELIKLRREITRQATLIKKIVKESNGS